MAVLSPQTSLERLQVLCAVASAGSIAGAARSLSYTPSAVSQQLAALEREAGTLLVYRSPRGVDLSPAGRVLVDHASGILDATRNAFDAVGGSPGPVPLRVAAFPTAISSLLLPIRKRIEPVVNLQIVHAEPNDALELLVARTVDCALTDGYTESESAADPLLERNLVRTEPAMVVSRRRRVVDRLEDLADADWVLGGPASRMGREVRRICRGVGFEPRVVAETEDHHVTFEVITATDAVSVLPELALGRMPRGIVVSGAIDLGLERRIELVTRRQLSTNPGILALAAELSS